MNRTPGRDWQASGTGSDEIHRAADGQVATKATDQPSVGIDLPEHSASDDDSESVLVPEDSEKAPDISVVMPTLNEQESIGECIQRAIRGVMKLGMTAEIIVSDDSTDLTPEIAESMGARVVTPDEKGYGYAYKYAFQFVRGDFIVMGDADSTYDFSQLPKLIDPILRGEADIVMGSRLDGEIKPGAMPNLHQYVGNPLLTKFLNVFYDASVSDAHSGYRVLTRDALETLDLQSDGMEFASEMVMNASVEGLRIEEVPITYHQRRGEATLESFRDGWRHVKFMLMNAPAYLFTIPAVASVIVGLVTMTLSVFDVQVGGVTLGIHTSIAGALLTIVGYKIGLLSLFSTISADPIKTPNDRITRWIRSNFRFHHGATLGLILFAAGAAYAAYLVGIWILNGYTALPVIPTEILAFTAMVLGVETIFSSFHLSALKTTTTEMNLGSDPENEPWQRPGD